MVIEKALRWVVISGVFALPFIILIVAQSMFFPFITGKNFTFRIIVEIIAGAWLALALVYPTYRPRRSWILGAFAIFVLIMAIADAQGAYPFKSFWSNYERMDGWVTLIHVLAYLVVASCVINSEKIWRLLFQVSLGVSVFVGIYGLLQIVGYTALGQGGGAGLTGRIDGTFGNPIYLAIYMLFHIAIAALLWLQMWNVRLPGKRTWSSLAYGGIILLDTATLLLSGTRGTMLGLIGGALIAVLLYAYFDGTKKIRTIAVALLVGVVVFGGVLKLAKDTPVVQSVGFLQRLATISLNDSTTKSRLLNMGMAWQGVKERPIFGWGQENYALVFDKYYDPRMYGQEQWFDRVHDVIFDWWVAGGTLGLLAYLSIFMAAFYTLWRTINFSVAEKSLFTGLIIGYFVHNIFVFDNVSSWILFGTILAYIVWRADGNKNDEPIFKKKIVSEPSLPFVAAAAVVLVWGVAWFTNANALAANKILLQAMAPQKEGITKNLEYFKQAISYGSFGTQEIREQLAQITSQISQAGNVSAEIKKQFFDLAGTELQLQAGASPLDARPPLFFGVLLGSYGDHTQAKVALARAHELSPRKQTILFQMAQNAQERGDQTEMIAYLKTAFEVEESVTDARIIYATALIRAGNDALADTVLAPIVATGSAADVRIASAYLARSRFDKIITIWEASALANPNNSQTFFTLAAAYYSTGNINKTIETLERVKKANPDIASQVDSLIQQVRSGTAKIQ